MARAALVREALAPLCRPAGTALVEYCLLCTGTGEWPGARQLVSAMDHEKTTTVGVLSSVSDFSFVDDRASPLTTTNISRSNLK